MIHNQRCAEVRRLLAAYAGGSLSPDRRGEVDRHLAACRHCSAELQKWHRMETLLHELARPTAPEELAQQVLYRIQQEKQERAVTNPRFQAAYKEWFAPSSDVRERGIPPITWSLGLAGLLLGLLVTLMVVPGAPLAPLITHLTPMQVVARAWMEGWALVRLTSSALMDPVYGGISVLSQGLQTAFGLSATAEVAGKGFMALAWSAAGGLVTWLVGRMTPEGYSDHRMGT